MVGGLRPPEPYAFNRPSSANFLRGFLWQCRSVNFSAKTKRKFARLAAPSAGVGSQSGIRLRLRPVGGRLASPMRWDKHICSGAVCRFAGGVERLIPRTSTWIGCALFEF